MFIENAYSRRDSLSDTDLERLLNALRDQVERYRFAIRNYPPERLKVYGQPHLNKLEARVSVVEGLLAAGAKDRN